MKVAWEMLDCTKRYSIGSTLEQKIMTMTGKLDLAPCAYMIICFSNLREKKLIKVHSYQRVLHKIILKYNFINYTIDRMNAKCESYLPTKTAQLQLCSSCEMREKSKQQIISISHKNHFKEQ